MKISILLGLKGADKTARRNKGWSKWSKICVDRKICKNSQNQLAQVEVQGQKVRTLSLKTKEN